MSRARTGRQRSLAAASARSVSTMAVRALSRFAILCGAQILTQSGAKPTSPPPNDKVVRDPISSGATSDLPQRTLISSLQIPNLMDGVPFPRTARVTRTIVRGAFSVRAGRAGQLPKINNAADRLSL